MRHRNMQIKYEGKFDDFHCFRLIRGNYNKWFEGHVRTIRDWVLSESNYHVYMGSGFFKNKLWPEIPLENEEGLDQFILFDHIDDISEFEEIFPIYGWSPTYSI